MLKIIFFFIISLNTISSFAADVEVTFSSPIVSNNVVNFDITGNNKISFTQKCSTFIQGYDSCVVTDDIVTVVYPLSITTNIQSGFVGILNIDVDLAYTEYFYSVKLLDSGLDVSSEIELFPSDSKSYQIEIKIKTQGSNSFQEPKGAINFNLTASTI
jgi:hypothetical protein